VKNRKGDFGKREKCASRRFHFGHGDVLLSVKKEPTDSDDLRDPAKLWVKGRKEGSQERIGVESN